MAKNIAVGIDIGTYQIKIVVVENIREKDKNSFKIIGTGFAESKGLRHGYIINVTDSSRIEMHVYTADTWITGNHKIQVVQKIPVYRDTNTNQPITLPAQPVAIDLYNEFNQLQLNAGNFRIIVNFFENLIGNYEQQFLTIDDISPDRTEVRLRAIDNTDPQFLEQIASYVNTVNQTASTFYKSYLLNFSRNQNVLFVNSVVIGEYLYVKLAEPLPNTYDIDFKCWVVREDKAPYIDTVVIHPVFEANTFNYF